MKRIFTSLILLLSSQTFAGSPMLWGPNSTSKNLQSNININDVVSVLTGSLNPSVVATSAPAGSLYMSTNGTDYIKTDNGLSTNWTNVLTSASGWALNGNAGTTAGTNFIGTIDAQPLVFKGNSTEFMRGDGNKHVSIGTTTLDTALHVKNNGAAYNTGLDLESDTGVNFYLGAHGSVFEMAQNGTDFIYYSGTSGYIGFDNVIPIYKWDFPLSDTSTNPATIQPNDPVSNRPLIALRNNANTPGNFSGLVFSGANTTATSADGYYLVVHDVQGASPTGHHVWGGRNGGSNLTQWASLSSSVLDITGTVRSRGLFAGQLSSDAVGNITSTALTNGTYNNAIITVTAGAISGVGSGSGGGSGTVTNVSATGIPEFSLNVTNPTTTPNIALTSTAQSANKVYAGPASGASTSPSFRSFVNADFPLSGAVAGTYTNSTVTVNAQGIVTGVGSGTSGGSSATIARFTASGGIGAPVDWFDGSYVCTTAQSLVKVQLGMNNSGDSGYTSVEIWKNSVDMGAVTVTANSSQNSVNSTLSPSISCVSGDVFHPSITTTPTSGNPQDLTVQFQFQ